MLLSAVSFLVVAQSSSEVPEGLMNNPVHLNKHNRKTLINLRTSSGTGKTASELVYCHFTVNLVVWCPVDKQHVLAEEN